MAEHVKYIIDLMVYSRVFIDASQEGTMKFWRNGGEKGGSHLGKSAKHNVYHDDLDDGFTRFWPKFIVEIDGSEFGLSNDFFGVQ